MAVSKAKKMEQVEKLSGELKNVSSVIVATYSKLTVAKDYELRKALRTTGAKYRVVKNTLAERASKGTKVEEALKNLSGVTSIAYTEGDPVALAKALAKYAKDNPEFTFKAGVVEGRVVSIKEIEALATMPSKEEIYSKLLFLLNAPAQRLVTAMNAVGRNLAVVIDQGVKEEQVQGSLKGLSNWVICNLVIETLAVEAERNFSITQFPNYQMKGLRYHVAEGCAVRVWALSGARMCGLVALETWRWR